ncbi:hypothetical protein FJY84_02245 [Candidatus Bathyarchaeota archaeon]|nr:hypothetical protein [Candidatus Bathyarchaeota archaeon]
MVDTITLIGIYIAVFLTLGLFTILYKENVWFRIAEAIYLGLAVGYGIAFDLKYLRDQWNSPWSKEPMLMVGFALAILVGILWYARFNRSVFYLYRWPLAITVGTGIGMALKTVIFSQFLDQIRPQINLNLWLPNNPWQSLWNILVFLMVPSVLLYFWFTGSGHEWAPMKVVDKFARYTMMLGFGYMFGNAVLGRYSLFIGRAQFLLGITPNPPEAQPAFWVIAAVMLITLIGWDLYKRQKS